MAPWGVQLDVVSVPNGPDFDINAKAKGTMRSFHSKFTAKISI